MSELVLTPHERQQLLRVLGELNAERPLEKRRDSRRKLLLNIWLQPIKGTPIKATLLNVATRGVGLLAPKAFIKGHKFLLRLRFREGGGWLVLSEVRNCAAVARTRYKLGARFLEKIDDPSGDVKPPMDWVL